MHSLICRLIALTTMSAVLGVFVPATAAAPPAAAVVAETTTRPALTAAQLASIDAFVEAEMQREHVPGVAVGVYSRGTICSRKATGLRMSSSPFPSSPRPFSNRARSGSSFYPPPSCCSSSRARCRWTTASPGIFPGAPRRVEADPRQELAVAHLRAGRVQRRRLRAHRARRAVLPAAGLHGRRAHGQERRSARRSKTRPATSGAYRNVELHAMLGILDRSRDRNSRTATILAETHLHAAGHVGTRA